MGYKEIRYRTFDGTNWTEHQCPDAITQTGANNPYATQVDLLISGDTIVFLIADYSDKNVWIYDPVRNIREKVCHITNDSWTPYGVTGGYSPVHIQYVNDNVYVFFEGRYGINIYQKAFADLFDLSGWTLRNSNAYHGFADFLVDNDEGLHMSYTTDLQGTHYYLPVGSSTWTTTYLGGDGNGNEGLNDNNQWQLFQANGTVYGVGSWKSGWRNDPPFSPGWRLKSWASGTWNHNVAVGGQPPYNQFPIDATVDSSGNIVIAYAGWGNGGQLELMFQTPGGSVTATGIYAAQWVEGDFVINGSDQKLFAWIKIYSGYPDTYILDTYYDGVNITTHGPSVDGLSVGSCAAAFNDSLPYVVLSVYSDSPIEPPASTCSLTAGDAVALLKNPGVTLIEKSATISIGDRVRLYQGNNNTIIQRSCPDIQPGDQVSITSSGLIRKSK